MSEQNFTIALDHEVVGLPDWHVIADKIESGHTDCTRSACCFRLVADEIREQAKPPKPAEPQGLGAVVEDAEGEPWVWIKSNPAGGPWYSPRQNRREHWDAIDVVTVLSEGVPQ